MRLLQKIKIKWSSGFAYAIGLITSDGWLSKDGRHIGFGSKDAELIDNFKRALSIENKVSKHQRGGEIEKKYFYISFGDKVFYKFLSKIGLSPAKSKTIESVALPDIYFGDFLRGLFDGDGTFYTYWDRRWPNSFCFKLSFASASINFIFWLKNKLTEMYNLTGCIHKGDEVYNLEYVKGDTKKLFKAMYHQDDLLHFSNKYLKIKNALKQDEVSGLAVLQKPRNAGLAQR